MCLSCKNEMDITVGGMRKALCSPQAQFIPSSGQQSSNCYGKPLPFCRGPYLSSPMSSVLWTRPPVLPSQPPWGGLPSLHCLFVLSSPLREELGARLLCRNLCGGAGLSGCGAPGWRTGHASNQDSVWEGEEEKHHLSWHSGMPGKAEQR